MSILRSRPAFWYIAFGCAFTSFVGYGNGNFFPSYLVRNRGMSIAEVGFALALVSGVTGAIGTFLGGFLSDKFGKNDKRWYIWIPIVGGLLSLGPAVFALLSENTTLILLALLPTNILNSFYLGPSIAMSHTLVSPSSRAMASAILFFVLNMIGLGLGPLMVGLLSDAYAPIFGPDNLRYAMLTTLSIGLLGALSFWMASRHLLGDLEKQRAHNAAA